MTATPKPPTAGPVRASLAGLQPTHPLGVFVDGKLVEAGVVEIRPLDPAPRPEDRRPLTFAEN